MNPPPEDQSPEGAVTLVQVLWAVMAVLGVVWGLFMGLLAWVGSMVWNRIKDLGERVHKVEGEQKAQSPMVQELWLEKRERDKGES